MHLDDHVTGVKVVVEVLLKRKALSRAKAPAVARAFHEHLPRGQSARGHVGGLRGIGDVFKMAAVFVYRARVAVFDGLACG